MDGDLRIGEWLIQPSLNLISNGEKQVSIEPKVMDALLYLASHPGEVVTKDQLIQTVWSGSFVTDDVVVHAISELRKAFQDDIRDPAVIRTVPKRGYQLIAPVHSNGVRDRLSGDEMVPRFWKWLAFGAICALVALGTVLIWQARSNFGGPIDSIAVLPLESIGTDLETEFWGEAIASGLSSRLAQLPHLRVIPTYRMRQDLEGTDDLADIAAQLGVTGLLLGTLGVNQNGLQVVMEFYDSLQDKLVWSDTFEADVENWSELANRIYEAIAAETVIARTSGGETVLWAYPTEVPEAYEYYWRGRISFEQANYAESVQCLSRAVAADPEFVEAHVSLSDAERMVAWFETSPEHYERSEAAARKALELAPDLPEAHVRMAEVYGFAERDWQEAAKELEIAKGLQPEVVSYHTPQLYLWMEPREEALRETRRYEEQGDPNWVRHQTVVALRYYWLRDFDRAIELLLSTKREDADVMNEYLLVWCYLAKGLEQEAFKWFLKSPDVATSREVLERYQEIFAKSGMKGVFDFFAGRGFRMQTKPFDAAGYCAVAGRADQAFQLLEETYALPASVPFFADARFDPLRGDLRYEALMRKLRLPEAVIDRHTVARR